MYEADSDYEVPESPIIKDYDLPDRRGFATVGNEIQVSVNAYPVTRFPTSVIHQYDVSILLFTFSVRRWLIFGFLFFCNSALLGPTGQSVR
jgi:hypothetical protein